MLLSSLGFQLSPALHGKKEVHQYQARQMQIPRTDSDQAGPSVAAHTTKKTVHKLELSARWMGFLDYQNNNFAPAIHLFVHFFACLCYSYKSCLHQRPVHMGTNNNLTCFEGDEDGNSWAISDILEFIRSLLLFSVSLCEYSTWIANKHLRNMYNPLVDLFTLPVCLFS